MRTDGVQNLQNELSDLLSSIDQLQKAGKTQPQDVGLSQIRAEALWIRVSLLLRSHNIEDASANLMLLSNVANELRDGYYIAYANLFRARILSHYGEYDDAKLLIHDPKHYFRHAKKYYDLAICIYDESLIYYARSEYDLAIRTLAELEELCAEQEDAKFLFASSCLAQSNCYKALKQYEMCELFLKKAKTASNFDSDIDLQVSWYISYAGLKQLLNDYQGCIEYLDIAQQCATLSGNQSYEAAICILSAENFESLGQLLKAEQQLRKAQSEAQRLLLHEHEANALLRRAELCSRHPNFEDWAESELDILMTALEAANRAGTQLLTAHIIERLVALHKKNSEYETALSLQQQQLSLLEEVFREDRRKQLIALEFKFNLRLLEQEAEITRLEREQLRERSAHLEAQLAMKTQGMLEQMKALQALKNSIYESTRQLNTAEAILRQVRSILNESPLMREDWDSFLETFSQVHPSFSSRLLEKYPTLTKMEVRICMLVKAQLNTEQIADLMSLSVRNIENHRYRLRKKMELQRGQSLETGLDL